MSALPMREPLPDRRRSWTQRVVIGGQTCYLCVGEYADGRPGELFIDISKQGTFLRGVMGTLARTISIALQCGADVSMITHALWGLDYPPDGPVTGSDVVSECYSVTDWIAQELEARYVPEDKRLKRESTARSDGPILIPGETGDVTESEYWVEFEFNPDAKVAGAYSRGNRI